MKTAHVRTFGRALEPLKITGLDFTTHEVASETKKL